MRRAKFEIEGGNFDGSKKCAVIVEQDGPHALVRVRPYRRHNEAVLPLADVAEMILMREARLRAAESSRRGRR
jgi:hypothetical protein